MSTIGLCAPRLGHESRGLIIIFLSRRSRGGDILRALKLGFIWGLKKAPPWPSPFDKPLLR
jgi:hypothetical protein